MILTFSGKQLLALGIAASLALVTVGGARAQCSPMQMEEARLQFNNVQPLINAQQWSEAIPQLRSIVDFCPDFFPAWRGLGRAYHQTGQLDQAAGAYEGAIAARGDEAEAFDFANLAKVYTDQKKYREARAEYLKAKAREPHNCAVLVNLGILHNAADSPGQAVETLEDALSFCPDLTDRIMPRLAEAATKAAEQQRRIGNTARAEAYAAKAAEYGGSAGGATAYQQIQASMTRRDFEGAVALCDQLLAKEPDYAPAWLSKARASGALGRHAESIEAYRKYLEQRPDNIEETAALIIVMAEAERCDEAVAAARQAVQRFTGVGSKALGKINFAYGKALFCQGDYAAARAQFQRAAQSGDEVWAGSGREGVAACDQQLEYDAAQRQRAAARQGG